MELGLNDICPCGSNKKYKHCCIGSVAKQHSEVFDDIAQTLAMNPNLTLDELNLVNQKIIDKRNNQPHNDFFGLSPTQMTNWLYSPFNELKDVQISVPKDTLASPVMRYLTLILDEAVAQGGSFKTTTKGNLPAKIVKQAASLLPEFAVAEYQTIASISEFTGSNEDKFNALHYSRILAQVAGIIYPRNGRLHIKKAAEKQYRLHGVSVFFLPMLEAATYQYNWRYFDCFENDVDLRSFWLFMLWRLQEHHSVDQLLEEVATAFPNLLSELEPDQYFTPMDSLSMLIKSRFIERFLQFWGFVTVDPKRFKSHKLVPSKVNAQALLTQIFQFSI